MHSPRFLRQHSIILKHKIDEDEEFKAIYDETKIDYVKIDENHKIMQSQKGIETNDDCLCIIDLNDLYATKDSIRCKYIDRDKYVQQSEYFSIFNNDLIIFEDREYTVTSINEIKPFGKIEFIEVRANAS